MDPSYNNPLGGPDGVPDNSGNVPVRFVSNQPATPVAPAEPIAPATPVQPVQPVAPAEPIQPAQPVTPVQPVASQPVTPIQPAQPMTQTTMPDQPVFQPAQPMQPDPFDSFNTFGGNMNTSSTDEFIMLDTAAPATKKKPKWLLPALIGAGALLIIVTLLVLVADGRNGVQKNKSATAEFIDENFFCIAKLGYDELYVYDGAKTVENILNNYQLEEFTGCVNQLSAVKETVPTLKYWENDSITSEEFEDFKQSLIDFITKKEAMLPVYRNFVLAFEENNEAYISEYAAVSKEDANESERSLMYAANDMKKFITERQGAKNDLENYGCEANINSINKNDACYDYVAEYLEGPGKQFYNNTSIPQNLYEAYSGNGYLAELTQMLDQLRMINIGHQENA